MFVDDCGVSRYTIANSLRLRSSASAYLSRTHTAADRRMWTLSLWVKRGALGNQVIFACGVSTDYSLVRFNSSDQIEVADVQASATQYSAVTTAVFRDPSAWYHIVVAMDTAQGTAANRLKVFVNGTQYAVGSTPPLNFQSVFNAATTHYFSGLPGVAGYGDMYHAESIFVNAQALTPSSFGQTDANGVWTPKAYSGSYGTNGFYLKFNDGSNTTNLCLDRSGNGNNWTPTNVSLTAGATYDWMVDTPTNSYCTINPLDSSGTNTVSAGNLTYVTGTTFNLNRSTFALTSGKWYWEVTGFSGIPGVGVSRTDVAVTSAGHTTANGWAYFGDTGNKWTNNSGVAYGATFGTTDVIGVALDMDAGTLTFYKNNVSQGVAFSSGLLGQSLSPMLTSGLNASGGSFNFGQRPFTYTPPSGFKALCTANLPAVTIANGKKHFNVVTYTGTGAARSVTGVGFQPDFVWTKNRSISAFHGLLDAIRGAGKFLYSDGTSAEQTFATDFLSFDTDGFSLGSGSGSVTNGNGNAMVAWNWKANGAGVTNTAGSITSTVSANTAAGFSIVTYTGTGANATVGHGLGVAPKLVIVKRRNAIGDWLVWHQNVAITGSDRVLFLNTTDAQTAAGTNFNSSSPTSSVINIGTNAATNANTGTYAAYCFAEVPGFSRFGSYTGNGSTDGPFVFTGFRPAYVMVKRTDTTGDWHVLDSARDTYNPDQSVLFPNLSAAEAGSWFVDFASNGFKLRNTGANENASGGTYIFAAFAENPFGGSNTAPATAR